MQGLVGGSEWLPAASSPDSPFPVIIGESTGMDSKLQHPALFILVGIPGSGKTYLARQLSQKLGISRVSAEQIRSTVLDKPTLEQSEEKLVRRIAMFLIEEMLRLGMPMICDVPAFRSGQRSELEKLARRHKFQTVTIYQQIDRQAAWLRCRSRHSQQADDRYAPDLDEETFDKLCGKLQAPTGDKVIVVAGSHDFNSQAQTILRRLLEMQILPADTALVKDIPKPGLINLIASQKPKPLDSPLSIALKKDG